MDIGVRELKERLSEILERAAAGETIRVTDRGRPKAILGPLPETFCIDEGIAAGWITPPASGASPVKLARISAKRRTEKALADDRGE